MLPDARWTRGDPRLLLDSYEDWRGPPRHRLPGPRSTPPGRQDDGLRKQRRELLFNEVGGEGGGQLRASVARGAGSALALRHPLLPPGDWQGTTSTSTWWRCTRATRSKELWVLMEFLQGGAH